MIDAYTLFLHARSAVTAAHYPSRINYTIVVSGRDGKTLRTNHYRAQSNPQDSAVRVFPLSEEELAAPPPVPHGFNFAFTIGICGGQCETIAIPAGRHVSAFDLLGVPKVTPAYAFGLAYPSRPSSSSEAAPALLPTIAIVSTKTRDYNVTLVDTPDLDGTPTYHLRLTPLRKPKDNRLRELWIGTADYLPRKAVVGGNFTLAPLVDVPWTIDFAVRDGVPYVVSETTANVLYMPHRHVVRDARIDFQDVRESDGSLVHEPLVEPDSDESTLVEP